MHENERSQELRINDHPGKLVPTELNFVHYAEFTNSAYGRLVEGSRRYGEEYLTRSIVKDISEELLDLANYAYLLWIRINKLGGKIA